MRVANLDACLWNFQNKIVLRNVGHILNNYGEAYKPTINPTLKPTLKLTKVQNAILEEISKNPNITQAELASLLKYQRSSISENR